MHVALNINLNQNRVKWAESRLKQLTEPVVLFREVARQRDVLFYVMLSSLVAIHFDWMIGIGNCSDTFRKRRFFLLRLNVMFYLLLLRFLVLDFHKRIILRAHGREF